MQCEWGQKAFLGYLGENKEAWKQYDACELATQYTGRPQRFLVDQGGDDEFLHAGQLRPESLQVPTWRLLGVTAHSVGACVCLCGKGAYMEPT